jgi:hypothetical protein
LEIEVILMKRFLLSRMLTPLRGEGGVALFVVLAILLTLSILGAIAVFTSKTEMDISGVERTERMAFYSAEAGLEKAVAMIQESYQTTGMPPSPLPAGTMNLNAYAVRYATVDMGPVEYKTLTHGIYKGLYALVKTFSVTAEATGGAYQAQSRVAMEVDDALIPLYQFAVFYEDDLEIAPSEDMVLEGRVHTNADMYLQCDKSLKIDSYTTAAGNMYHGRHPDSGKSDGDGDVLIKDGPGDYQNMKNEDGTWLDCTDPDWVFSSYQRWDGRVEDRAHGNSELYLPVVQEGESRDLIKRGSESEGSYEHKADLKFVDGAVYAKGDDDDEWVDVTAEMEADGILTYGSFYNYREGKWISSYDIDISQLNNSVHWPENGIVYAAHTDQDAGAIRLVNGQELAGPLTVATENPLYTLGHYNTQKKQPASLLCDAFNVLSTRWDDSKSTKSLSYRRAGNTTVNACFMAGTVPSGNDHYSGGLENLPRFLEKWTNSTFTYYGSMVCLWESQQATGTWFYGGSYYTAPNRAWAFDTMYLDPALLPPGTPQVNSVMRGRWIHKLAAAHMWEG